MDRERQKKAPIYEALEAFKKKRVVPFDVPGHKRGRGNPELVQLLGEKCVSLDVNSMKPLDNLCHPVSVIKEAEELAASEKPSTLPPRFSMAASKLSLVRCWVRKSRWPAFYLHRHGHIWACCLRYPWLSQKACPVPLRKSPGDS